MKVIKLRHRHFNSTKPNQVPIGRVNCTNCGSRLEYCASDVDSEVQGSYVLKMLYISYSIKCPVCGKKN